MDRDAARGITENTITVCCSLPRDKYNMDMNFVLSSQQRMVVGGTKKQYEYGADKVKGTVRIIALFVCLCVCVCVHVFFAPTQYE